MAVPSRASAAGAALHPLALTVAIGVLVIIAGALTRQHEVLPFWLVAALAAGFAISGSV
ncbi:hypothetical protein [Pimelobacter simplex]|uniref:hypothetical protein n=1 Tax=Nocardioides simplex TaxID=2045 RepID=UPI00214FC141|nr:hypothetical protein [Pimelobacter simplex]UUW92645.1 hypothetical protein M0M43_14515 [Pimelobacter simplex]UUW96472.1 hypothetical protein M0M48_03145 [Pimelobacter simplex]